MATTTPKYGLRKPDPTDLVNVSADIGGNMDLLDAHAHTGTYALISEPIALTKEPISTLVTVAAAGATPALNFASSPDVVFDVTLTANAVVSFSNVPAGARPVAATIILRQDGTGSRLVTWPASVKWPSAAPPLLSAGVSKVDVVGILSVDAGTTWLGFPSGFDLR